MELTMLEDVIDSRDIIARIEELTTELGPVESINYDAEDIEEMQGELDALTEFAEQGERDWPEWSDGVTIIRDDYLTDYFEEYLQDIGDLPDDLPPYLRDNIDWDGVKEDLLVDYSSVEFDGEMFWARSA